MRVALLRKYGAGGTNGELFVDSTFVCYTIELPWLDNKRSISCIPEGRYLLAKRYSKRFAWHVWVQDVPGRSGILFHPANTASKELRGCIAPVTLLLGLGRGSSSRAAFRKFRK
ncbi:DUF5675 family protein [Sphingobacterium psychroaquaticum]|uniref:DUF5675 domain-containing protein n=1 Tax=Sphingobacterium psychroaquaticum TaxID=561061 RepID=A0A1X7LCP6_9SPHI|nr:DUF5675 family protein [Sphingobacterium psychroaquaticum]SMG51628.1 hypothetical protein SAMN05660862_0004 [Sphingobacterium psychroaquaticum]